MRAEADNLAAVEHEDLIGMTDGADALGDDDLRRAGQLLRKSLAQRARPSYSPARRTNRRKSEFPAFSPARARWKAAASARRRRSGPAGRWGARPLRGSCSTNSAACDRCKARACSDASVFSAALCPKKTLSSNRAGEQNGLLRHIAELVVKRVERILAARPAPSTRTVPAVAS